MKTINTYLQEIAWLGLAAAAGAAALYNRMMSDAARNCNQLYGTEKTVCMLRYKIEIASTMISKSKNPEVKQLWNIRLKKYQYKLAAAQSRLAAQRKQKK